MATVVPGISRTFSEYLLLPNLTRRECIPANVSLRSPLARHRPPAAARLTLNVPLISAMMQSVSTTPWRWRWRAPADWRSSSPRRR
jgi:IMP dehydrogenase